MPRAAAGQARLTHKASDTREANVGTNDVDVA